MHTPEEHISLNKYISSTGFCSRREADKLIEQGRVSINGKTVKTGARVKDHDSVAIDGEPVKGSKKARPVYIVLNKPVGVTSTTDPKDKTNIIYFLDYPKRIFPIGRLDKDSDGLILLTNDGDIVNKILRASNNHEKEYIVSVNKPITPEFVTSMSNGIPMLGTVTNKCYVKQEGNKRFRIILTQGLNRQIRRMCEYLGYDVMKLTRVRVMNIKLEDLPSGKWRYLTNPEIDKLNDLVATSTKTEVAPTTSTARKKESKPKPASTETKRPQHTPSKKKSSFKEFRNNNRKK
ncbi:23S rRNA pseudouridine(2604) synthase RluF [Polluticoccus soli]|uniref:23S rRNA pseudouridine(2604) synthase RluF n=1 Tax=Polluticoccus soli TaxID=3034150 RepID=UPI0023E0918D|nr:23S rRNA pseudouridine(2604) synthase RluF [Flavipsychrobacter sp. JY13-12]